MADTASSVVSTALALYPKIDQRRLVAAAQVRMLSASSCVFHHCNLKPLLQQCSHVSLHTKVG